MLVFLEKLHCLLKELFPELSKGEFNGPRFPNATSITEVIEEINLVKRSIIADSIKTVGKSQLRVFVRAYQDEIAFLMDELSTLGNRLNGMSEASGRHLNDIQNELFGLLNFLMDQFPKQFNYSASPPEYFRVKFIGYGTNKIYALTSKEPFLKEVLPFIEIIAGKIKYVLETGEAGKIGFKDYFIVREIICEFSNFEKWRNQSDLIPASVQILIFLNFEDRLFIQEIKKYLLGKIFSCEDPVESFEKAFGYYEDLKLLPEARFPWDGKGRNLVKGEICHWIRRKTKTLELENIPLNSLGGPNKFFPDGKPKKLLCNLSVDQIGILLRAIIRIGLISGASARSIFNKFSLYIRTNRKGEISGESMRSKSYLAEKNDLQKVKNILLQLINEIETM